MDLKTLLACFMGRHHRYRLTDVDFTTFARSCEEHGEDKPPRPKKRLCIASGGKAEKLILDVKGMKTALARADARASIMLEPVFELT